jgi:hypothetical protein
VCVCKKQTIDPIFNTNSYETVAGYVELSVRFVCMIWFVIELKETFGDLENAALINTRKENLLNNNNNNNSSTTNIDKEEETASNERDDVLKETDCDLVMESDFEFDMNDDTNHYSKESNGKLYKMLEPNAPASDSPESQPTSIVAKTSGQIPINSLDNSMTKEEKFKKYQKFYLHYGACCLVWFIYLPMLVFVTSFLSELFRLRLVLSIEYLNFIFMISFILLFHIKLTNRVIYLFIQI